MLASWFCSPFPWIRTLFLVWRKLSSCIAIHSEVPVLGSPSVPREKRLKKTFSIGMFIRCTVIIHLRIKQSSSSHFHVSLLYVSLPLSQITVFSLTSTHPLSPRDLNHFWGNESASALVFRVLLVCFQSLPWKVVVSFLPETCKCTNVTAVPDFQG